jgi:hypothetical protein
MRKILLIALLSTTTLLGCKKKDDGEKDKAMDKMADQAKPDPTAPTPSAEPAKDPAAAPATPPAPAGDNPIKNSEDFVAVNAKMNGRFVEAMKQPDCDKAAAALGVLLTEHGPDMLALKKWQDQHPDDKAKVEAADKAGAAEIQPVIDKCKDNKAFMDTLGKLPN